MSDIIKGIFVLAMLVILLMGLNTKIVQANKAIVIERIGQFLKIIDKPGFYFTIPVIDRVVQTVPLDVQDKKFIIDVPENLKKYTLALKYQIFDVKLFVYGELDSLSKLKDYIKEHANLDNDISEEDIHLVSEYAEGLGIRIIKMCVK